MTGEFVAVDVDTGEPIGWLLPPLPDGAPRDVLEGLVRRRLCATERACPCGAPAVIPNRAARRAAARKGAVARFTVEHEGGCPAVGRGLEEWQQAQQRPPADAGLVREPSAWLRGAAAERVRQLEALELNPGGAVVVAPLGRSGPPGSREDRTCDRCRIFVPGGAVLHPLTYKPTPGVVLVGGLCERCCAKEQVNR